MNFITCVYIKFFVSHPCTKIGENSEHKHKSGKKYAIKSNAFFCDGNDVYIQLYTL
jgi:hypothetical protein